MRKGPIIISLAMVLCLVGGAGTGYAYVNYKNNGVKTDKTVAAAGDSAKVSNDGQTSKVEENAGEQEKPAEEATEKPEATNNGQDQGEKPAANTNSATNSSTTDGKQNKQTGVDWDLSSELNGRVSGNTSISSTANSELLKAAQSIALGKSIANLNTIKKGWDVGSSHYAFYQYNKGTVKVTGDKVNTTTLASASAWKPYNVSMAKGSGNYKYMLAKYTGNNTYEITYVYMGITIKAHP